jgi:hypothetical protein
LLPIFIARSRNFVPCRTYEGSSSRIFPNCSGYSDASTANPTPPTNTAAGRFPFITNTAAAAADPAITARFQFSISSPDTGLFFLVAPPGLHSPVLRSTSLSENEFSRTHFSAAVTAFS